MQYSWVYPKLPDAGLGNMLLVWARALVFAIQYNLPIIYPSYRKIKIGPWIRREEEKRFYQGLFVNGDYVKKHSACITLLAANKVFNPRLYDSLSIKEKDTVYVFNQIPHWDDYFVELKDFQILIKQHFIAGLAESLIEQTSKSQSPEIGIHVRLGDFRALKPSEDFTKVGLVRTPQNWYANVLESIRSIAGYSVPATIFSDGHDHELQNLLSIPNVTRNSKAPAVVDLITLSKSKILITSASSTFSGWASFLGGCPTIYYPTHFHGGVFSDRHKQHTFEGEFHPNFMDCPTLLRENIIQLFKP